LIFRFYLESLLRLLLGMEDVDNPRIVIAALRILSSKMNVVKDLVLLWFKRY